jgi:hypothetical protein
MAEKEIRTANTPILGTLMYKRWQGRESAASRGWEVSPEYRGFDLDGAKRDAHKLGINTFEFAGETYTLVEGQWFKLILV